MSAPWWFLFLLPQAFTEFAHPLDGIIGFFHVAVHGRIGGDQLQQSGVSRFCAIVMGGVDDAGIQNESLSTIVAGLVGITPAAGFVDMPASLVIGAVAGLLGFISVAKLKQKIGYDDSLDAFGVHGVCGIWGALATGLFATPAVNPDMEYRRLGNTGLQVSILSFGSWVTFDNPCWVFSQ